jgi:hypothetical protein
MTLMSLKVRNYKVIIEGFLYIYITAR